MNIRRTVITGAAALALVAGGTLAGAVAFASSGTVYKGCIQGTSRTMEHVYTRSNPPACPTGSFRATWNQVGQPGPQGPSGVVSMASFDAGDGSIVTGSSWAFSGTTVTEHFADTKTAAEVTVTVDEASSNGNGIDGEFGICYEPVGGSTVTAVNHNLEPAFQAPANSYFTQTVSGVVGNLAAGDYIIGMCQENDTANLLIGFGAGTIIMAETASGVSSVGLRHGALPAQPHPGRHP